MKRALLVTAGVVALTLGVWWVYRWMGYVPGDGPEQPVAFPHTVHAGDNQIPCMYCHYTADKSPSAGIPSVQLCVGCHVPGSAISDPATAQLGFPRGSDQAELLVEAWRRGEPIPWVRVHSLPEHVRFPHDSHINVGLQCQTCHGPVEEMEVVYQFSSLRMGWCIECHRGEMELGEGEQRAVEERSSFLKKVAAMARRDTDLRGFEAKYPGQIASVDCTVCHY
ncbi:MAG: cytochrome c3 family protein [Longimicrobiaceae bacterium]